VIEVKQIEQIPDRGVVRGNVRVIRIASRIAEVVAAATGERFQMPISLDKFQDRDVVGVGVVDVAAARER